MALLGKWVTRGPAMTRPKWSDATGEMKLKQENFRTPPGWRWSSDWEISPEMSLLYNRDAGLKVFVEDVYELQTRLPAGPWSSAAVYWTNAVSMSRCPCMYVYELQTRVSAGPWSSATGLML